MYEQKKYSESKVKFREASNSCRKVLEASKFTYANKTKNFITSKKLGYRDVWRFANSLLNKGKFCYTSSIQRSESFVFLCDKAKLFAKNFSKNSNLEDSGIPILAFPSGTTLELHNIYVTPTTVKKVIMYLDSSKASGSDYIPVVVLKNSEPELSYLLAKLFNMCLKEYCFSDSWRVSSIVLVFNNVGEKSIAIKCSPVILLFVVSKFFKTCK